jgi:hypothetical protein
MSSVTFEKYRKVYEEVTGHNIDLKDIPNSLRDVLTSSSPLSSKDFASLTLNEAMAYVVAHRLSEDEAIKRREKDLQAFENQYGMPSAIFMEKWENLQLEEEYDFFVWAGAYRRYLQLKEQEV